MRQRGSSWELRVYAGRDVVTGRKRWVSRTVKGGKREAQRALAAMVAEADRGALTHTTATVGELLEEWFALASPGFSPKGAKETRGVIDRNLLPFLGNVPLSKLGAADLDRFYRRLREKGGRAGRPLAPATIRRAHGVLHRALGQGVRWGWLGVNRASSATPPRVPMPDINPPAPHELAKLFALATEADVDLADFILLAAATGARRSELIALRWTDFDLDGATVWKLRCPPTNSDSSRSSAHRPSANQRRLAGATTCNPTLNVILHSSSPDDALVEVLLTASRALVGVAARSLADIDEVTLPQFRALVVLATRPGTTVSDLAHVLDVHPSTATRLCDRLVAKKLVRRRSATTDRRSTELYLAAAGTRLVERVSSRRRRDLAAIASRLSPDQQRHAVEAFLAFGEAAGEVGGADLFGWDVNPPVGGPGGTGASPPLGHLDMEP